MSTSSRSGRFRGDLAHVERRCICLRRRATDFIERDSEGYYVASVPSLPGCHTQARSLDTLMERIREAIELYREVMQDDSDELDYVGVQKVRVTV